MRHTVYINFLLHFIFLLILQGYQKKKKSTCTQFPQWCTSPLCNPLFKSMHTGQHCTLIDNQSTKVASFGSQIFMSCSLLQKWGSVEVKAVTTMEQKEMFFGGHQGSITATRNWIISGSVSSAASRHGVLYMECTVKVTHETKNKDCLLHKVHMYCGFHI